MKGVAPETQQVLHAGFEQLGYVALFVALAKVASMIVNGRRRHTPDQIRENLRKDSGNRND